jgi:hypothetical protein
MALGKVTWLTIQEHAVIPTEIEQPPNVAGFMKLASSPSWRRVQIQ